MGHGQLPPCQAPLAPQSEVDVDLVDPWSVNVNGHEIEFESLTCIDPVANLTELIGINNKKGEHVSQQFACV